MTYDAVVCAGPHHQAIAPVALRSLQLFAKPRSIYVITAPVNFQNYRRLGEEGLSIVMVNENRLIEGVNLDILKDYFAGRGADPSRAGWYFQQFLKMSLCFERDLAEYYLIWDSDTVMLRSLSFFDPAGKALVNPTDRYHKPYFETIERLLGISRRVDFSYISEHLMIRKSYMRELIEKIQALDSQVHWTFTILDQVEDVHLGEAGFSEFETYGNYVHLNYPGSYRIRDLRSLRSGAKRAGPVPRPRDLLCFSRKYAYVSFEVWTRPSRWKHLLWVFESGIYHLFYSLAGLFSRTASSKLKIFSDIAR